MAAVYERLIVEGGEGFEEAMSLIELMSVGKGLWMLLANEVASEIVWAPWMMA
jgi:hypothetical protein